MRPLALVALLAAGCRGKEPDDGPSTPVDEGLDVYCPGPGCEEVPGAPLEVGVGVRSVVPDCFESWEDLDADAVYEGPGEAFLDCGCDRLCAGDPGYPGADEGEGDGKFQAVWMAGFQNARAASGVRDASVGIRGENDGLWARALILQQGETRIGFVVIDAMGWMYDDVLNMRAAVAEAGIELDHLVIHSSHGHEGPDTMGIYGPTISVTGYDPQYAAFTYGQVVAALTDAQAAIQPVTMELGQVDATTAWDNGIANLVNDHRDPFIVDPRVSVARFVDAGGDTLATMVHFANHPETVADENTLLTSDFAHALRETVESGVTWDAYSRNGVGGVCLYVNGAVGGMMTSLGANVVDPDGGERSSASFEKADIVGQLLGELALDAIDTATPVAEPRLAVRADTLFLPVTNAGFQVMFALGVLGHRSVYHYDPDEIIDVDNQPDVKTEVDLVEIGPLHLLTIPGELLPELAIGGYDGSFTPPGVPIIAPDNPLPPDLSLAPPGPYLLDRMTGDQNWIVGLGNDELGYIIPEYNFVLHPSVPYLLEAEGDHYEETNGLGPETAGRIEDAVVHLLTWEP